MDLATYIAAFNRAAAECRDLAQQYVVAALPKTLRFDFAAARRKPDSSGRIKYLGGRLLTPGQLRGVTLVDARKYLWVDGRIPCWVNFNVHACDEDATYIEVCSSGDLTSDDAQLMHAPEGNPPFHILSPALASDWVSLAESGNFPLPPRK